MKKSRTAAGIAMSALILGSGALIALAKSNPPHKEAIEEECYIGIKDYEIDTMSQAKYYELTSTDITGTTPTQNPDKSYYESDGIKELSTYITLEKRNGGYKIFVKQTVEWKVAPQDRYTDILGLNFTDDLIVDELDGRHNLTATLNYTENEYDGKKFIGSHDKSVVYTGKDIYSYRASFTQIAFLCPLPRAEFSDSGHKIKTDNISISLETTFLTASSDSIGAEMQSIFMHQNGSGEINWSKLNFRATPTVSYKNRVWVNDPEFDTALFSFMSFSFDDLMSQS